MSVSLVTLNAPNVVVPVTPNVPLTVKLFNALVPLATVNDVNAPVPGVTLPIAVAWIPAAVIVEAVVAPVNVVAPVTPSVVVTLALFRVAKPLVVAVPNVPLVAEMLLTP